MGTGIDGHKPFWLPAFVFVLINSLYKQRQPEMLVYPAHHGVTLEIY